MSNNSSSLLRKYKEEPSKITADQKDRLILEYAPLIKFIAQKIAVRLPANIELDDLISSGVIGLMDAIEIDSRERRDRIVRNTFKRGLLLLGCGYKVIRFLPPLDVRQREIDLALEILEEAIKSA